MTPEDSNRVRPLVALRAVRALIRDPDDTGQVFVIMSAMAGKTRGYVLRRFFQLPDAMRLIAGRPLSETLSDHEALRAMPKGSLADAYLAFCERTGITADGLVSASEEGAFVGLTPDEERFADRLRDMHDLWHVITGYHTDVVGEAGLLAFTLAQTRNRGIAVILAAAMLDYNGERAHGRKVMVDGYLRGKRAAFLPGVDWEAELSRPLAEVRARLGIGAPPSYVPVWSAAVKRAS